MIRVIATGTARINCDVEINISRAEFDALSPSKQQMLVDAKIDWKSCEDVVVDDIEIDDVLEV